MNEKEKWNYIVSLDEELLHGGVILSEKIVELIRNADISFIYGAYWSSIITSVAAIEGYLKSEIVSTSENLGNLINESGLGIEETKMLHNLRRYRNQIVHMKELWDDALLLNSYEEFSSNEEHAAMDAIKLLRTIVYSNPFI